jgi:hypothetical protein
VIEINVIYMQLLDLPEDKMQKLNISLIHQFFKQFLRKGGKPLRWKTLSGGFVTRDSGELKNSASGLTRGRLTRQSTCRRSPPFFEQISQMNAGDKFIDGNFGAEQIAELNAIFLRHAHQPGKRRENPAKESFKLLGKIRELQPI